MDASIILAGRPLDVVGAMRQGNAAAMETNALRQQNQLTNLYQTQGAGILAGNQQSLNALAGIDPAAALNVRGVQQDMQATQQRMDMLSRDEQRQIEAFKAQNGAAEAAAAAAKIEDAVKMGLAIQTPQQWDAMMAQNAPELVGQFENRQAFAQKYMTMAEALKASQPAQTEISPNERFKVVGGVLMDLAAEGGPRPIYEAPMQTETIFGPDGKPIIQRGGGAGVKFTEAQSKDNVYATRARGALAILDPIASELTSVGQRAANADPTGIVRGAVQSDAFQQAQQAGQEFLQAVLRKDTGAAITADEQELYGKTYLPQPGDNPAVLAAKKDARTRAIAAIEAGMTPDQLAASDRALVDAARANAGSGSGLPETAPAQAGSIASPQQSVPLSPDLQSIFDKYK